MFETRSRNIGCSLAQKRLWFRSFADEDRQQQGRAYDCRYRRRACEQKVTVHRCFLDYEHDQRNVAGKDPDKQRVEVAVAVDRSREHTLEDLKDETVVGVVSRRAGLSSSPNPM